MRKVIIIIGLLLSLLIEGTNAAAQGGVSRWQRYDVNLIIQQNSGITVEEIHDVALVQGATTYQKVIPADKLEAIDNIQVLALGSGGGQRAYQQADTQADYTFQIIPTEEQYTIQLYFPPNNVPTTKFVIRYFVVGGLRFYDDGDQLDWRPFGWSAPAPIVNSTTSIKLPSDVPKNQLTQSSSGVSTEKFAPEAGKATFIASNIGAGNNLEVSLKFPHGIVQGRPPSWQRVADTTPVLQWGSVILAVVVLLLGLAAVLAWWYFKLRVVPEVGNIPKYIRKPPGPLTPAVAGALLDGRAAPRHIMATLLDLAAKGALNVYNNQNNDDGEAEPKFNLYNVSQDKATEPYETTLYGKTFGYMGTRVRRLSDVRRTLYMSVPELKNQIDLEIAKAEYFAEDLQRVKRQYAAFGGAGILISLVLALLAVAAFSGLTFLVVCPFLSVMLVSAAFIFSGFAKARRTQKGTNEAAQWEAFKRYLKEMNPKQATKARAVFHRLLPYAVAFGVEKEVVQSFAAANTVVPKWWSIPEEKLPDIDHEDAHAWVSESLMAQPKPQSGPEKQRTKSVIRRLGMADTEGNSREAALKGIQPVFLAFLKTGLDVFTKAPPLDADEAVEFDSLGNN